MGILVGWYEVSLEESALFCNVACYDYFKNDEKIEYSRVAMIRKIFALEEDNQLPCFIFHFIHLCPEEKAKLFKKFPRAMVSQFLQWPLSLTFLENIEQFWYLIPYPHKHWVFLKIIAILFPRYYVLSPIRHFFCFYWPSSSGRPDRIPGIYCVEHLKSIWIALWKISLDSYKSSVLSDFIFPSIFECVRGAPFDFREIFESSGLKEKLFHIFFKNGEAILDLYSEGNMRESLRSLVAKHTPEDFEDLDRRCISFIGTEPYALRGRTLLEPRDSLQPCYKPINKKFVSFIKDYLFSSNSIDKTLFY
ncbi:hypothetical protein AVEN_261963-1 [Araneus ventricosus]|uniref:Uncharacterized protein n=1 Tax=Araneus ventricosus TaxID=182803 RepID=A0A4Y2ESJ3_ARAVE|nr:hypothetical protein AVEN_261963-1 [Araneus ventricosus]